jgi:hypothetical protein
VDHHWLLPTAVILAAIIQAGTAVMLAARKARRTDHRPLNSPQRQSHPENIAGT